jgi:hypothetical protein
VPFTRALGPNPMLDEFLAWSRPELVAKADCLTRGQGVYLGSTLSPEQWAAAIAATRDVIQRAIEIPARPNLAPSAHGPEALLPCQDYFGVDLFYFGNDFAGPVSRSHTRKIFNIGSGGKESPTLVVGSVTHVV